jgi:hypothetical protein
VELEAMIETRGAQPGRFTRLGLVPSFLARDTLHEGQEVTTMQPHRTVDEAATPQPPASTPVTAPVVPQRSARRATARRASNRRATARQHKDDIEERVSDYLNEHPLSTTGDLAKGLNADRGKVAAARSHIANAGETAKDHTDR